MRFLILLLISFFAWNPISSQYSDIGVFYGKFYSIYKFQDQGSGFRNLPGSQNSGYPTITFNRSFSKNVSGEVGASFLAYQQYTGTRLYSPGFFSVRYVGNITTTANYAIVNNNNFSIRLKGGFGLGIMPDVYTGRFTETFSDGISVDSVSRGVIKRDFRSLFPLLCTGIDFSYKATKRIKLTLRFEYQVGVSRISEYEVFYNDGTGNNDQFAKQWGNGTFYGFQLGARYNLKKYNADKK
jgi:hypothetical protein